LISSLLAHFLLKLKGHVTKTPNYFKTKRIFFVA